MSKTPEQLEQEEGRRRAAAANGARNEEQLTRREQIARNMDARRSTDLEDSDGASAVGRFAEGEFDESPEARERAAEIADREAEEALQREADEQERALALQAEGGGDPDARPAARRQGAREEPEEGDRRIVDGVEYFLTIVSGNEKWLTLEQLRAAAQKTSAADETLQRANDALQRATQLALAPRDTPSELGEAELEEVIASAALGDGDAVKKLASAIKARPSAPPADVSRQVSEQLATQRAIDQAEREQAEILQHASLSKVFRLRLKQLSQEEPDLQIVAAYRKIGAEIRQDFGSLLTDSGRREPPPSKDLRKRTLVTPPRPAARTSRTEEDDEQEESPSAIADRMAKSRGQQRAVRHGRVPG